MIRHILTVSTGTLASRTLGFTRDALIAALLGAGPVADAFLVAFQFINVTRRSFTEGALNSALVPDYLRVPTAGTRPAFVEGLADLVERGAVTCGTASGADGRICPLNFGACPMETP